MARATARSSPLRTLVTTTLVTAVLAAGGAAVAFAVAREADIPQVDTLRIPRVAYDAYVSAAAAAPGVTDGCDIDWTVLAGLARIESKHGLMGGEHRVRRDGRAVPPIRGPALDGTSGTRRIADTEGGAFDGDATWDRAMGPFQFIPTSWAQFGRDGNGDGIADPDNVYDAALRSRRIRAESSW